LAPQHDDDPQAQAGLAAAAMAAPVSQGTVTPPHFCRCPPSAAQSKPAHGPPNSARRSRTTGPSSTLKVRGFGFGFTYHIFFRSVSNSQVGFAFKRLNPRSLHDKNIPEKMWLIQYLAIHHSRRRPQAGKNAAKLQ
jgi:hypothetical protein